jgi:hypothetical protein
MKAGITGSVRGEGGGHVPSRHRRDAGQAAGVCAVLLLTVASGAAQAVPGLSGPVPTADPEVHVYEITPEGRGGEARIEHAEISYRREADRLLSVSKVRYPDKLEDQTIVMAPDGRFLSAEKRTADRDGRTTGETKAWVAGDRVLVRTRAGGAEKMHTFLIPPDRPLAVDVSLLALFRVMPLGRPDPLRVFMLDLAPRSIGMSLASSGTETVRVPGGVFECYRVTATLEIPLVRPTITYWVTKAPPHFLVKHQGKRGPFTPVYTTVLIR